jgi:hypothetical protein
MGYSLKKTSRQKEKRSRRKHFPAATKPAGTVKVGRTDDPTADRHPNVPGRVDPGPATKNVKLTARRPRRVLGGATPIVVVIIPVVHPLPYIPQHVV